MASYSYRLTASHCPACGEKAENIVLVLESGCCLYDIGANGRVMEDIEQNVEVLLTDPRPEWCCYGEDCEHDLTPFVTVTQETA